MACKICKRDDVYYPREVPKGMRATFKWCVSCVRKLVNVCDFCTKDFDTCDARVSFGTGDLNVYECMDIELKPEFEGKRIEP